MFENLVSSHGMAISGAILIIAYIVIASEKFKNQ